MRTPTIILSDAEALLESYGGAVTFHAADLAKSPHGSSVEHLAPDDYVIMVHNEMTPVRGRLSKSAYDVLIEHEVGHVTFDHIAKRNKLERTGEWMPGFEIEMEIEADRFAAFRLGPANVLAGLQEIQNMLAECHRDNSTYMKDRYEALRMLHVEHCDFCRTKTCFYLSPGAGNYVCQFCRKPK